MLIVEWVPAGLEDKPKEENRANQKMAKIC